MEQEGHRENLHRPPIAPKPPEQATMPSGHIESTASHHSSHHHSRTASHDSQRSTAKKVPTIRLNNEYNVFEYSFYKELKAQGLPTNPIPPPVHHKIQSTTAKVFQSSGPVARLHDLPMPSQSSSSSSPAPMPATFLNRLTMDRLQKFHSTLSDRMISNDRGSTVVQQTISNDESGPVDNKSTVAAVDSSDLKRSRTNSVISQSSVSSSVANDTANPQSKRELSLQRNRMAAKRFRERKKEKESVAMQRYDELQKTNTELKQQMKWLSEEIQVLRRLLVQRECIYYRATKRYHKIEG